MTKKAAETVETIHPYSALAKNWWVRAGISFFVGIFVGIISHLMPAGTYIGFLFGLTSFILAIVAPVVFVILAMKEEDQNKY